MSYSLDQCCEIDFTWHDYFIEDYIELDFLNLTYWLILIIDVEIVLMDWLIWMDDGSFNWWYRIFPRGLTYFFSWCLYILWRCYFNFSILICISYAFIDSFLLRFCMIDIEGGGESEYALQQWEPREDL